MMISYYTNKNPEKESNYFSRVVCQYEASRSCVPKVEAGKIRESTICCVVVEGDEKGKATGCGFGCEMMMMMISYTQNRSIQKKNDRKSPEEHPTFFATFLVKTKRRIAGASFWV